MAKRTNQPKWTASGNFETVRFDVIEPPKDDRQIHLANPNFRSKYKGVTKKPDGKYWYAFYDDPCGKRHATKRNTEIRAAVWVDNKIRELGTGVKTNYDLYGEYWK